MNTKTCQALIGLVAFLAFGTALAGSKADIVVTTQNQYLGADLTPIIAGNDPNAEMIKALTTLSNNNYAERVQALAESILDKQPHLVALQEVYAFECLDLYLTGQCAAFPNAFNDHLGATMAALGDDYTVAAVVQNLTLPPAHLAGVIPGVPLYVDSPWPVFIRVIDRDVILARADVDTTVVEFECGNVLGVDRSSVDGCNYKSVAPAELGGIPFNIERGFVGVDATIKGADYRFINTHLEVKQPSEDPMSVFLQPAQASELWAAILGTFDPTKRLIVTGDFNSSPVDMLPPPFATAYQQFTGGVDLFGNPLPAPDPLTDTWYLRPGKPAGFTCCELEDLSNAPSMHYERIDIVFAWPAPTKVKSNVLDDEVADKTLSGLWPSDHASVSAELSY